MILLKDRQTGITKFIDEPLLSENDDSIVFENFTYSKPRYAITLMTF